MSNQEAPVKTHWKKLQHPDYIGAYTIMDGVNPDKELIVTIEKVVRQQVTGADGKKEECTVCYLIGQKPMILNSTNQKTMTKLFGSPFIEDWQGKKMALYVAKVKAFGDTVDALRVREKAPALEVLTPTHQRWEGAVKALRAGNTTIEAIQKNFTISAEHINLLKAELPNQTAA